MTEVKILDYKTLNNTGERVYRYDLNFYEYGNRSTDQIISDSDNSDSETTTSGSTFKSVAETPDCTVASISEGDVEVTPVPQAFDSIFNLGESSVEDNPFLTINNHSGQNSFRMSAEAKALQRKLMNLEADIDDHIEENKIDNSITVVEDIDMYLMKVEGLRTEYRKAYHELLSLTPDDNDGSNEEDAGMKAEFSSKFNIVITAVKNYVIGAKDRRSQIRKDEARTHGEEVLTKTKMEENAVYQRIRSANFLLSEVSRMITELHNEFSKIRDNVSDEELMRRNTELVENQKKCEKLSKKFQQFLKKLPENPKIKKIMFQNC